MLAREILQRVREIQVRTGLTEQLEAWPKHAAHMQSQRDGRDTFYSEYRLQECELVRMSDFGSAEP